MADLSHKTDGPSPLSKEGYDESLLPDFDHVFISEEDIQAFATALSAPDPSPSTDDLLGLLSPVVGHGHEGSFGGNSPISTREEDHSRSKNISRRTSFGGSSSIGGGSLFITAQNDWAPINPPQQKLGRSLRRGGRRRKREKKGKSDGMRTSDETREGYLYTLLKWPFLATVGAWMSGLGISYMWTRLYIWLYGEFSFFLRILVLRNHIRGLELGARANFFQSIL